MLLRERARGAAGARVSVEPAPHHERVVLFLWLARRHSVLVVWDVAPGGQLVPPLLPVPRRQRRRGSTTLEVLGRYHQLLVPFGDLLRERRHAARQPLSCGIQNLRARAQKLRGRAQQLRTIETGEALLLRRLTKRDACGGDETPCMHR